MSQQNIPATVTTAAAHIRLLVLDVDGVMTDGGLNYGPDGTESKTFHVRDGLGIKLARRAGIEVAVISGRGGDAVERRMKELGIRHVRLNREDKQAALAEITEELKIGLNAVACVGDDTPDLQIIEPCALGIAVADAHHAVRLAADWSTTLPGGRGAVREVCDMLVEARSIAGAGAG
ncbi:MAG: KdsC family phosphatase [Gammaproteobacteria bacterium]